MAQALTAMIPLQDPTLPRPLEELSDRIGKLAPAALNTLGELSGQISKLAPSVFDEYGPDFWQRSVLFLDILRQRGNQREEMLAHGATSVLIYDSELVMRGDELPHPVNYSLLRIIPPDGAEIDDRKHPVFVIDPRAGQGPGIGGFKQLSEIGDAFKAGHPVYFAGFTASPVPGQRIEDVARAHTIFIEKITELHPEALGKPFVFGNCQAGWHAMMAACMRPDVVGPMVIAGAPLSYWGGVRGKNAMRYLGGLYGGTWLNRMMSDIGNGIFDAAWLVANFDNLKPFTARLFSPVGQKSDDASSCAARQLRPGEARYALDAAARVLVFIGKAQHRIEKSTFDSLRKLLLAHPEVSPVDFKAAVREQWAILAVDERAAIEALPQLLPAGATARRAFSDMVQATVAATGTLNAHGQRRLSEVKHLLATGTIAGE